LEGGRLGGLRGVESEQLGESGSVGGIFDDTELQILVVFLNKKKGESFEQIQLRSGYTS